MSEAVRRSLGFAGLVIAILLLVGSGRDIGGHLSAGGVFSDRGGGSHAIEVTRYSDGLHFIYSFRITDEWSSYGYEWRFGDGGESTEAEPYWVFSEPGTYRVGARIQTSTGAWLDLVPLEVEVPESAAPEYGGFRGNGMSYLVVDQPGEVVALPIEITSANDGPVPEEFVYLGRSNGLVVYQVDAAGFFKLTGPAEDGGAESQSETCYVFVSPSPTVHTDRTDVNWYKTQFNTGTTSNCGPTVAAMAYTWATGNEMQVYTVRQFVGWRGEGGVNFSELHDYLTHVGVQADVRWLSSPEDIMDLIDQDHMVGIAYDMGGLQEVEDPLGDLFGQYYTDNGGHYLAIKGYTTDRKHFVVYDPIPSDWGWNAVRYDDGMSMIGRNRYYPVEDLWRAMRSKVGLVVSR